MYLLHQHNYNQNYTWVNYTSHRAKCRYDLTSTQGHVVSSDAFNNGQKYARCMLCGGLAERGFIEWTSIMSQISQVTLNGSFVLPNGVVVLANEDTEAYLNGTLVFNNKYELLVQWQ